MEPLVPTKRSLFNFERKNMEPNESNENQVRDTRTWDSRFIKFNHEEIEALLNMITEVESNAPISEAEKSAKDKLKRIYARQILSHEKREREGFGNDTNR